MRRIEHDKAKRPVAERHLPEVPDDVRLDFQEAPVAKRVRFLPAIHEHHVRMAAVKPEHAGAAAGVKNGFIPPPFLLGICQAKPGMQLPPQPVLVRCQWL